jgi:hypothetical protein
MLKGQVVAEQSGSPWKYWKTKYYHTAEQKDRRKKTELTDHFANLSESQTALTIYTYVNGFKTHASYKLGGRNQRFGS